jgi:hypothetical protein
MTAIERAVLLVLGGFILAFRIYFLGRCWNLPMNHGQGFFLGIEVPPGFYSGPGTRWMKRYHSTLLSESLVEWVALAAIVAAWRLSWMPAWAGGIAVLFSATLLGFIAWARRSLGGSPRKLPAAVSVSLETRRMLDHMCWPVEAFVTAGLTVSWLLLLTREDASVRLQNPAALTFVVLWLLAGRFLIARSRLLLPSERTEEYHRWSEEYRRHLLRLVDAIRWWIAAIAVAACALHFWPSGESNPSLRLIVIGVLAALWLLGSGWLIHDIRRLSAIGHALRPTDIWRPFQPRGRGSRVGWAWMIAYAAGLLILLSFFRC